MAVDIRQSLGGELFTARAFNEIMPGSVPKQVALRSRTCQTLVAAPRFFRLSCTTRRALKRATRHSISSRRSRRYRRAFTPATVTGRGNRALAPTLRCILQPCCVIPCLTGYRGSVRCRVGYPRDWIPCCASQQLALASIDLDFVKVDADKYKTDMTAAGFDLSQLPFLFVCVHDSGSTISLRRAPGSGQ